jgi:excisionase family DNA binding protein
MRLVTDTNTEKRITGGPTGVERDARDVGIAGRRQKLTMSLPEAAQVLGVHRTTAWSLYKRGEFPVPVLKVGSSLRIVTAHLEKFMEAEIPGTTESIHHSRTRNDDSNEVI